MARTVGSEEERLRRIFLIKDYVMEKINNNEMFSTRSIARYFTENNIFSITNNTVSTYLNSLEKIDYESYKIIREVLDRNKPKTVADEEVRERINKAVILLLEKDYTVVDIANELGISPNIIYEDFQTRLIKMGYDTELLKKISKKIQDNRFNNLKNQGGRNHR